MNGGFRPPGPQFRGIQRMDMAMYTAGGGLVRRRFYGTVRPVIF
jgi:hypothetical protein